jgi:hypothetical protein
VTAQPDAMTSELAMATAARVVRIIVLSLQK